MERGKSCKNPEPGNSEEVGSEKRHRENEKRIAEAGKKQRDQQKQAHSQPKRERFFRFLASEGGEVLEIRRDRTEQAEDFLKKPSGLLPQRRFGGVGGIDRSVQSQSRSAAEDEAEKEAHAESDAHGLKRVRSDVGFGFALIILSVGRGVAVNRLRAAAKLVGFRAGLVTDVSVGSAGRFAEVLGGGTQMLASGVIGGLGVFFHGFPDGATGFGGGIEGLFGVLGTAFQLLGGNVVVVGIAHKFVFLRPNPATQKLLGKPQPPRNHHACMSITTFAPGRVEILGNHTDYNGGVVLSAALHLGITATGEKLPDGLVELTSGDAGTVEKFDRTKGLQRTGQWTDYPLGVAEMLARAGAEAGGFAVRYDSTLPTGAGLSSSAALEVATAALLMKLYPFSLSRMEVAKLCRRAENEFVGVNCGLLDQASSVFGLKDHLVFLDCRAESVKNIPLPSHFGLLIINSGVKHALVGGEYNERREQCFEAARRMGVEALRDVTMAQLEAAEMPDLAKRRARHVVGENERVFQAIEALNSGDGALLGTLMTASHRSSMVNFENSTAELDLLVDLAIKQKGCLGARLSGGGFGGAIVALVEMQDADSVLFEVKKSYEAQTHHEATGYLCRAGDGALPPDGSGA